MLDSNDITGAVTTEDEGTTNQGGMVGSTDSTEDLKPSFIERINSGVLVSILIGLLIIGLIAFFVMHHRKKSI